jgi:hypothetical protein
MATSRDCTDNIPLNGSVDLYTWPPILLLPIRCVKYYGISSDIGSLVAHALFSDSVQFRKRNTGKNDNYYFGP